MSAYLSQHFQQRYQVVEYYLQKKVNMALSQIKIISSYPGKDLRDVHFVVQNGGCRHHSHQHGEQSVHDVAEERCWIGTITE
jgi:hypothetical protein